MATENERSESDAASAGSQADRSPSGASESGGGGDSESRAQEAAGHLKSMAVDQLRERADSARERALKRIRRVGSAVRWAGEGLRGEDDVVAQYAEKASARIEQFADYLGDADVRRVTTDAEAFARTRPAVFFGGAFLLGLAAGRFMKSSPEGGADDEEETTNDSGLESLASSEPERRGASKPNRRKGNASKGRSSSAHGRAGGPSGTSKRA